MTRSLCLLIFASLLTAADFPQAELSNGRIVVKIDLPDAHTGYYRGTRFDWSGMIQSVVYNGHEYAFIGASLTLRSTKSATVWSVREARRCRRL